jgi:hypothetical protein
MSLKFVSPQVGYIFGVYGYLAKTTDQGSTWNVIPCPQTLHFVCAHAFDEQHLIAGTGWGKIVKSDDGGQTWVEKHSESGEQIADICFIDNLKGFAVSGHSKIYSTNDGGETWAVTQVGSFRDYTHIHFTNALTGWISGSDGYMLRTNDGGITWEQVYLGTHQAQNVVYFLMNKTVLFQVTRMLLHTSNGGYTAIRENEPEQSSLSLAIFPNPVIEQANLLFYLRRRTKSG